MVIVSTLPHAGVFDPGFELWIVGYPTGSDEAKVYLLPTHGNHPGATAWAVNEVAGSIAAPPPQPQHWGDLTEDNFDPERDGIALLEAQRLVSMPLDSRKPGNVGCIVGGFAQLTVLSRSGVNSRVIHRWPDRIGERMDPVRLTAFQAAQAMAARRSAPIRWDFIRSNPEIQNGSRVSG